ncbi:S-layer homology domain-containing protein [Bengtsoniella intestinalis]|uniref:S-layer homology domain-containing protein n=1 Tax=Bengtsoniella intestinalis TaxID=3073143 RepID=UPI00391EE343
MKQAFRRFCCLCLTVLTLCTMVNAHSFTDVPSGHWAEDSISRGVELGLFNGTSTATFGVGQSMTRGAFVVLLGRLMDWDTVSSTAPSYTDVATTSWCYSAVETALANEVITTQFTTFRPDESITREEMAVMLIRALGYTTLAGLVQDLSLPFIDVHTNRGYIAMAYEIGLMTGTTATTFDPSAYTTREQTAVILMRLYDKLNTQQETYAIVSDLTDTAALQSQSVIALSVATLSSGSTPRINPQASTSNQQAAIATIHENGGTALLYLTGTDGAMRGLVSESVDIIVAYLDTVGYDGLFLDVAELGSKYRTFYLQLVQALHESMGDDAPLFVMAEAPSWHGTAYNGYDYGSLSLNVDRLVLRIAPYTETIDTFLVAPVDPIEEVYYALTHLPSTTDFSAVSLLITTTANARTGNSGYDTFTASDVASYLADADTQIRTSERYDCGYLMGEYATGSRTQDVVAWYLNGEQVLSRTQLCDLFGVTAVVLSDGHSLLPDVVAALG